MKPILITLFGALFLCTIALTDEHGHNHEAALEPAPHGGQLRDAAPYKAELVLSGDMAKIYIYTKDLKPALLKTSNLSGKFRLPKDKREKTITFTKVNDAFEAKIPGISKVHRYDMHIPLNEDGQSIMIDFGVDNIH